MMVQNGFLNAAALGGTFTGLPSAQPDPRFLAVTGLENAGISNYDGLTIQYRRAFAHGFQGQINYTWSHDLDDISNGGSGLGYSYTTATAGNLINPNIKMDYGNADYDIRNSLQGDFLWDLPWKFNNKGLRYLLGGWTVSSKLYLRSGTPNTLFDGLEPNIFEGTLNAGLTPTAIQTVPSSCGTAAVNGSTPCLNSSMFLPAGTATTFGNIGRGTLFGPGYFNIDSTLMKNFNITERVKFTIGASAFNILNHPHFAGPDTTINSGGLGGIYGSVEEPTSAYGAFQGSVVTGRVMVLTAKFRF
jgi:hypothetical protein